MFPRLLRDLCAKSRQMILCDRMSTLMMNEQNSVKVILEHVLELQTLSVIHFFLSALPCSGNCHSEVADASLNIAGCSSLGFPPVTVFTTSTFSNPSVAFSP
jgi:hypothetical protein